jgi:Na+/proline symporter
VLQAVVVAAALVALPVIAISSRGGMMIVLEQLRTLDPALLDPISLSLGAFAGLVGIGLGSPGSPHGIEGSLSIRDADGLRAAAVIGTAGTVVLGWGAVFVGLAGRAWYPDLALLPGQDPESISLLLAREHLPPALFGVAIAALFAAILSAADSQLRVASSALVRDLGVSALRRGRVLSPRALVAGSRAVAVGLVAPAVLIALSAQSVEWLPSTVFWLVLLAWAGLGASIGPTLMLAVSWKGATRAGVLAGVVAGAIVTLAWGIVPALDALVYELIPGFAAGLLTTVVVSSRTAPPADAARAMDVMAGRAAGE